GRKWVPGANPAGSGQALTFTATVTGSGAATPTGLVTFSDGATSMGQGTLSTAGGVSTASFTTSSLTVGSHTLTSSYGGDGNFTSSSGTLSQTVGKATTSTAVVASVNPSVSGQSVTFTVTVSGTGTPTGLVVFSDGATSLGQGTLSTVGGVSTASFSSSTLTAGSHTLTASYAGDGNFAGSVGTLMQAVSKANTNTVVVPVLNPALSGQTFTFVATVTVGGPGSGIPTGTVQF